MCEGSEILNTPKMKMKMINAFSMMFDLAEHPIKDETIENKNKIIAIDKFVICCAIPKSDYGKNILRLFIEDDKKTNNIPNWESKGAGKSKISLEFLTKALSILKTYTDAVWIETSKDYLINIETYDFQIMIAPRVEET
jgi:hypothetical protein